MLFCNSAPVSNDRWNMLLKELKLKSANVSKGKRIYVWISIVFEETSTFQGEISNNKYRIEGYLKPVEN